MIREYALEPNLLSNWKDLRYFVEKFSVAQGRVIAEFPGAWRRMVFDACAHCGDVEKHRITEKLRSIADRLIRRGRPYNPAKEWLDNAVEAHAKLPFHAIVACRSVPNCDYVLVGEGLDDSQTLWKEERSWMVRRQAQDMADAAALLLEASREIVFVDPNFRATSKNYRLPLEKFLERVAKRSGIQPQRLEYHLGDGHRSSHPVIPFASFQSDCMNHLPRCVPSGMELTLVRWKQEALHNRYVLTERGVLEFGNGLDEGTSSGTATDTVKLLDETVRVRLWKEYVERTGLSSAGDPANIVIKGERGI